MLTYVVAFGVAFAIAVVLTPVVRQLSLRYGLVDVRAALQLGGVLEGGDLGLVDYILHANAVPIGITELTFSATSLPVTVAVTVYVPSASAPSAAGIVQTAIANYFAAAPIGGYLTGVPVPNTIPVAGLLAFIAQTLIANKVVVIDQTATLNGSSSALSLTAFQVATISGTPTVTVIAS